MIQIIKEITLEVSKPNLLQAIAAKQGDIGSRFLKAKIVCDGIEIVIPSDSSVKINALRTSDGMTNSFDGVVNEDNTVLVPLHEWMLALEGLVQCDVSIIKEDKKLTSTSFFINVEKAANVDNISYNEELYSEIQKLLNDCKAITTSIPKSTASTGTVEGDDIVSVNYDNTTGFGFLFDIEKITNEVLKSLPVAENTAFPVDEGV